MRVIYLLIFASIIMYSCKQNIEKTETIQKNDLLSNNVSVKQYINIANNENADWVKSAIDNKLLQTIINLGLTKVKVYNTEETDTNFISIEEINTLLGKQIDSAQIEVKTNVFVDTVIEVKPKIEEVEGLFFKENWYFDATKFKFTKEITEYLPVREYYKTNYKGQIDTNTKAKKLIFRVVNKPSKNYTLVAENIATPFYFNTQEPNFITGLDKNKFAKYLIDYALNTKNNVYNYYEQKTKLTSEQVKESVGATTETIQMEVKPNVYQDAVIENTPELSEFIGVIFIENWYIDKETLSFKKEVVGIAPIRNLISIDENNETFERKKITYLIKLTNK